MFKKKKKKKREREGEERGTSAYIFVKISRTNAAKLELRAKNCQFFASILRVKPIAFAYIYIIDQKFEITYLDCLLI